MSLYIPFLLLLFTFIIFPYVLCFCNFVLHFIPLLWFSFLICVFLCLFYVVLFFLFVISICICIFLNKLIYYYDHYCYYYYYIKNIFNWLLILYSVQKHCSQLMFSITLELIPKNLQRSITMICQKKLKDTTELMCVFDYTHLSPFTSNLQMPAVFTVLSNTPCVRKCCC